MHLCLFGRFLSGSISSSLTVSVIARHGCVDKGFGNKLIVYEGVFFGPFLS